MTAQSYKKTSYSVDAALAKDFAIECMRRDVTQSEALTQAIRLWLTPDPVAVPTGNDQTVDTILDIVNCPRNETEKLLRNLLKTAINLRYIADEPIAKRNPTRL